MLAFMAFAFIDLADWEVVWVPALLVAVAFYWFGPFAGWLEIDEERIGGGMGRHRWEEARLEDVEAAYMVKEEAMGRGSAFMGVILLLRAGRDGQLRMKRLTLADGEAFLADLASQSGLRQVEGGVARR